MGVEYTKLTWKCELCEDVVVSRSDKRWEMDYCKCGNSAVDLESHYQRNKGKVKEIKREFKEK